MKEIRDLIHPEYVFLDLTGKDKFDVIHKIILQMRGMPGLQDAGVFEEEVVRREREIPTGLQMGAALPHARSRVVDEIVMAFARLKRGVNFGAGDNEPARLVFLFGVPNDQINDYLKLIAKLCRLLKQPDFRKNLMTAKSAEEVIQLLYDV
ncbi:MAG: PTS sugar transporter subunit IIA [Candidatus Zixiibacteriota bacterium]|nr:MAG: PTS sugar transporter subunit IIA [candidate division Zixibacteria bacterium]